MPDIDQMKESRFLTKADVTPPVLLTIRNCEQMNVAKKDQKPEMKWGLNFVEVEKPLVLNQINRETIAAYSARRNSDNWGGVKVVLYFDPNVPFGGKVVGGIRARAPKAGSMMTPQSPPNAMPEEGNKDVPF